METTTIQVLGMSCMGCVGSIKRTLESLPGVKQATVSLERSDAEVKFDPAQVNVFQLKEAVMAAGYDAP